MQCLDLALSAWAPRPNTLLHRVAPRDPRDRVWNYEDRFDFFTIIYDVFWSEDGRSIIAICPPPLNLQETIFAGTFREFPSGALCTPVSTRVSSTHVYRFEVSPGTQGIELQRPEGSYFLTPQPNLCSRLKGERLIVTVSRNNELHWIRDWLHFHVKMHGCTGVILYDNGSDAYTTLDIADAIRDVPGLNHAVIASLPFPFGVTMGPMKVNDSRFLQLAALQHAKYRLARRAASLLHIDIDELVVSDTRESVFAAVEASTTGNIKIDGVWVERATEEGRELAPHELRHAAFRHVAAGGARTCNVKAAIAPERVGDDAYMTMHRAYGAPLDLETGARFRIRHFLGLKTEASNIKNRERLQAEPFVAVDPARHAVDAVLAAQLDDCFGEEDRAQSPASPPPRAVDPDVIRHLAGLRAAAGDMAGGLRLVDRAIALRPDYPSYHQFRARCLAALGDDAGAAGARADADALLAIGPTEGIARIREASRAGRSAEVLEEAERLCATYPESADAFHALAQVLERCRRHGDARAAYRAAIELDPAHGKALLGWAGQLGRAKRYEEAAEVYARLFRTRSAAFGDRVGAVQRRGVLLERLGRQEEALDWYEQALRRLGQRARMTLEVRTELERAVARLTDEVAARR